MTPLNAIGIAFALVAIVLIFMLPKKLAPAPFLVGVCYMTLSQGLEIGPFHFFTIRLLIAAGLIRIVLRNEKLSNSKNKMDMLMLLWAIWVLISGAFHKDPSAALVAGSGLIYSTCGIYILFRVFLQTSADVVRLCCIVSLLLLPVALEMVIEKLTAHNFFSILGGVDEVATVRNGSIRAQGPFAHAILAGTVGAACLPLAIGIWSQHRKIAAIGIFACSTIIVTSASSGPLMSAIFGIAALLLWKYRHLTNKLRWGAFASYIIADFVMKAPAYYLLAHIDLTGSSTGWHRARLIESSIEHIDEWWLAGTDYTRHWMPTGVSWSLDHTDITNHYLQMGVIGGLPLMMLFVATLWQGFNYVTKALSKESTLSKESQFFFWALGSSLFAHACTSISVAYFDQSFIFIYFDLAALATVAEKTKLEKNQIVKKEPKFSRFLKPQYFRHNAKNTVSHFNTKVANLN